MQVTRIRLQNYRNIPFVDIQAKGLTQFFVGRNAQGKTNLLEGVGLLAALRSFRTQELNTLILQEKSEAKLSFNLIDERFGATEVLITLKRKGKEVQVDGERISRFRDFIGRFPVVVLSSQDIQLLRGSPGNRRKWLDLILSSADPGYFEVLKDYHKLLLERNALLKSNTGVSEIEVFEKLLSAKAAYIRISRESEIQNLETRLKKAYSVVSPDEEFPELIYKPDTDANSEEKFQQLFAKNRERDRLMKSTQHGPHRDDLTIRLQSRRAREFASEGQQRSLMISLKIAQLQYLHDVCGVRPVLLADDVLGELDQVRKSNFWKAIGDSVQVIATGTEVPRTEARINCQVFEVSAGSFQEQS
jgi:DNA replication and repair protein RecF